MKITKSAVKAALKPNEKPTVTPKTASAAGTSAPVTAETSAPVTARTSAPATSSPVTAGISAPVTTIEVKKDVGFGNAVFMRGQGGGLTWERGLPLVCVDAQTWRWSGVAKDPIKFKVLINDKIWSAGNDLVIAPGQKMQVAPEFA